MAKSQQSTNKLEGRWIKVTTEPCAEKYPATLTFAKGTYQGHRGPTQGLIWWDAGIYRLENDSLVIGTATDELVTTTVTIHANRFEFTDQDGCHVTYRRAQPETN